jgi:hypothetical protein
VAVVTRETARGWTTTARVIDTDGAILARYTRYGWARLADAVEAATIDAERRNTRAARNRRAALSRVYARLLRTMGASYDRRQGWTVQAHGDTRYLGRCALAALPALHTEREWSRVQDARPTDPGLV